MTVSSPAVRSTTTARYSTDLSALTTYDVLALLADLDGRRRHDDRRRVFRERDDDVDELPGHSR